MIELVDFVPHGPVPAALVEEYRDRVPDELVEIWEEHGFGVFGEGFLRIVDPKLYEAEIGHCIGKTQGEGVAVPILATGLGDLITWEPGLGVVAILFREGRVVGLGSTLRTFLALVRMDGAEELSDSLHWDLFPAAVQRLGAPSYDESFVSDPLFSADGRDGIERMRVQETIAVIQRFVESRGVIGH